MVAPWIKRRRIAVQKKEAVVAKPGAKPKVVTPKVADVSEVVMVEETVSTIETVPKTNVATKTSKSKFTRTPQKVTPKDNKESVKVSKKN
tara:strand:+ start:2755 stop:3024 length:270 start_codon:yes stop_codon:yes gene_type:complete